MAVIRRRVPNVVMSFGIGVLVCGALAPGVLAGSRPVQGIQVQHAAAQTARGGIPSQAVVSLTFDDGKKNQFRNAMPVLDKAGLRATFYVIGGAIDDWPEYRDEYMDATEVKALSRNHEVGNHSWNHGNLADLTESAVRSEFSEAQKKLTSVVGTAPKTCAYPFGGVNTTVAKVAKEFFSSCRTTASGLNSPGDDLYRLKIFYMTSKTTTAELSKALADAKAKNKWMVVCYHSVRPADDPDDDYDVTTAAFQQQIDAVKKAGIPVRTVSQALGVA